jgi:phosphoribosylaminoimidazole carboxylase PurE protein
MKDILFLIGSESDKEHIAPGVELAKEKNLSSDLFVYSAHRHLTELLVFLEKESVNYRIIIAAAGLAAALPGVVAAKVAQPVIGVPLAVGPLNGIDALLSILQLPKGTPVATMGVGKQGVLNAVLLAEKMLNIPTR